jgi:hypothetical protein
MTKREKLKHCTGCRDNFYNGHNDLGVSECWSLEKAKMVWKKEVSINQRPPWNQKARRFLSCFHRPGYVYVQSKQTK